MNKIITNDIRMSQKSNDINLMNDPKQNLEENEVETVQKENLEEQVLQPAPIIIERRLSPEEILLGKLREFVHMKSGQWNHEDWIWLLNRIVRNGICLERDRSHVRPRDGSARCGAQPDRAP